MQSSAGPVHHTALVPLGQTEWWPPALPTKWRSQPAGVRIKQGPRNRESVDERITNGAADVGLEGEAASGSQVPAPTRLHRAGHGKATKGRPTPLSQVVVRSPAFRSFHNLQGSV